MALELATQRWGEQGTPLVILHGLLGAGRNWQTIGSQMAEEFQVIAPDLRNHGQSPHSERMIYADLVEDVLALVRKLERPVHLLGHSLGGKVAMRAALAEPAAFASLTVVDMAPVTMAIRLKPVLNAVCELRIEDKTSRAEVDAEPSQNLCRRGSTGCRCTAGPIARGDSNDEPRGGLLRLRLARAAG